MDTPSLTQNLLTCTYNKILEACLQDEAIETLKILQNKDYLLQRVNELFAEIYVEERQRKLQELTAQNRELLKDRKCLQSQSNQSDRCSSCDVLRQQMFALQKQKKALMKELSNIASFEEKESKKLDSLLLNENQQMKKQVKKLEHQLIAKKIQWNEDKQEYIQEVSKAKSELRQERQQNQKIVSMLKNNLNTLNEEKIRLEKQVFTYVQQKGKEEKEIRQLTSKKAQLTLSKEKLETTLDLLQKQVQLLNEKAQRVENENEYLKERVQSIEKENKQLKKANTQLLISSSEKDSQARFQKQNEGCQTIDYIDKNSKLLRLNLELQKQNRDIKEQLSKKQIQFQNSNVELEKQNIKLKEEIKRVQVNYEKNIRQLKEETKDIRQRTSDLLLEEKEHQQQAISKKHQSLMKAKLWQIQKLQEQNKQLNTNLLSNQELMTNLAFEYQEEKKYLTKQLEKERQINRDMKKHYNQGKISTELFEKEYELKQKDAMKDLQQMRKTIAEKDKELKKLTKALESATEENNNKEMLCSALQQKNKELHQTIQIQDGNIKTYKDNMKHKDRTLKQLTIKLQDLQEEKESIESQLNRMAKNNKILEERVNYQERQLNEKRDFIVALQDGNKNEILQLYQRSQIMAAESKRQLESYYLSLLKNQDQIGTFSDKKAIQREKEQELVQLQHKKKDLQEKIHKFKGKHAEELRHREEAQAKLIHVFEEMEKLKSEHKKLIEQLTHAKKQNVKIIRVYQQKMMEYYTNFGQFKRELFISLREQLQRIKSDLKTLVMVMQNEIQKMKQCLSAFACKVSQQIETLTMTFELKVDKVRHSYEYGVVLKLQEEKREAQVQYQMRIKEQSMEMYTILAQKEHLINALEAKEAKNINIVNQLEIKNSQHEKIAREHVKKNEQMKEILAKMNQKVNQAQKSANIARNEVDHMKKENVQLRKELLSLETAFKEKIEKARQNYTAQNERLFARYEKEFSKFITSNKKGLQYSMLSQSKSSTNILIPTKGCQNDSKLEKLQRQIQQQKKKLNMLSQATDEKGKLEKTSKLLNRKK